MFLCLWARERLKKAMGAHFVEEPVPNPASEASHSMINGKEKSGSSSTDIEARTCFREFKAAIASGDQLKEFLHSILARGKAIAP